MAKKAEIQESECVIVDRMIARHRALLLAVSVNGESQEKRNLEAEIAYLLGRHPRGRAGRLAERLLEETGDTPLPSDLIAQGVPRSTAYDEIKRLRRRRGGRFAQQFVCQ